MTDPLRAETQRLLALDGRTATDITDRVLRKYAMIPKPDKPDNIAALFDHLRTLQAEVDRRTAECEALRVDADRYQWLRMQDWFDGPLCVLRDPKAALTRGSGLGADCPSRMRLDTAIDAAMDRERSK